MTWRGAFQGRAAGTELTWNHNWCPKKVKGNQVIVLSKKDHSADSETGETGSLNLVWTVVGL